MVPAPLENLVGSLEARYTQLFTTRVNVNRIPLGQDFQPVVIAATNFRPRRDRLENVRKIEVAEICPCFCQAKTPSGRLLSRSRFEKQVWNPYRIRANVVELFIQDKCNSG
jgi:hypothetical protein